MQARGWQAVRVTVSQKLLSWSAPQDKYASRRSCGRTWGMGREREEEGEEELPEELEGGTG